MHKKPLSSRFPHTLQLAAELGKPLTFIALDAIPDGLDAAAVREYAAVVVGNFEFPYVVEELVDPGLAVAANARAAGGSKVLAPHPTWPEVWQGGLGNTLASSLVLGDGSIANTLALLDAQARRYELPPTVWDFIDIFDLFRRASGREWKGNLLMLAEELGLVVPGAARQVSAGPILMARLTEAMLGQYGAVAVGKARQQHAAAPATSDPFALEPANDRFRPELRVVPSAPALPGTDRDPFDLDGFDGDNVPPMTPFHGGAFTLQELLDTMLDRLVEDGLVRNYADVIGVLRGLGLVVEKSRDPYQGVVVETAVRAKRRLKGRYFRPTFVAADSAPAAPAPASAPPARAPAATERTDLLTRLELAIRSGGYRSLEHQLRLVEAEHPEATRQTLAYAICVLLSERRLEHELAADETIQGWLVDVLRPLVAAGAAGRLKMLMGTLLTGSALSAHQKERLDYVQLRVALHRLGVDYPGKKRAG